MPMEAQTRLLRVLQQGEYTTVGGRSAIKTNVRIIAATNKDLGGLIRQGLFREDLFFRLNVVPLRLPPLRERLEDIGDLAQHFFVLAAAEGLPLKRIEPDALERLKRYRWPGNIRELENLTRRLAALYPQEAVTAQLVDMELGVDAPRTWPYYPAALDPENGRSGEPGGRPTLAGAMERHLSELFHEHGTGLPPPGLYHRILRELEYPLISAALAATRGNQIKAAELLGLNRNTLRKKVRDLDIRWIRSPR
jgi:two-component system nitrogen regulation response regulator GlnG